MKKNPNLEIICFDLEGTILQPVRENLVHKDVPPSVWVRLAEQMGPEVFEAELESQQKWLRGEYRNYAEWMEDCMRGYRKHGLRKEVFDKVMDSIPYHRGVKEAFAELKKMGFVTALITGGFKMQADRVADDLDIKHVIAATEFFWNKKNKLSRWNVLPCDEKGKPAFLSALLEGLGYSFDQCGYVGDSINDIGCAKAVGVSVAFNGHPELQKICSYSINQKKGEEDFRPVVECFSDGLPF